MSRMNGRNRRKWYPILVQRDGESCKHCGVSGTSKQLVIHHIDDDNGNNHPNNLLLLCRRCNYLNNPRGKGKKARERARIEELPTTETIVLSQKYKPKFRQYVETQVAQKGRVELDDLINSGAEITGASIATIRTYIPPLISSEGRFQVVTIDGVKYLESKR